MVVLSCGVIESLSFVIGTEGWVDEVIYIWLIIEDWEVRDILLVPNTHVKDNRFDVKCLALSLVLTVEVHS